MSCEHLKYLKFLEPRDNVKLSELGMHCDDCDIIDYCNGYEDTPPCEQPRFENLTVFEFLGMIDYMENKTASEEDEPLTEPKALTWGEMAQMDGKPVWIVTEYDDIITGLISLTGNCFAKEPSITLKNGNFLLLEDMGACKAYTHKPKED